MIKEQVFYTIQCDYCKEDLLKGMEVTAYSRKEDLVYVANESQWLVPPQINGHCCPDCIPELEKAMQKLIKKLESEPLAKEREELGRLLMKHIDDFSPNEMKRYNELKEILHNSN